MLGSFLWRCKGGYEFAIETSVARILRNRDLEILASGKSEGRSRFADFRLAQSG